MISNKPWFNLSCQQLQPLAQQTDVVHVDISLAQEQALPASVSITALEARVSDDVAWSGGSSLLFTGKHMVMPLISMQTCVLLLLLQGAKSMQAIMHVHPDVYLAGPVASLSRTALHAGRPAFVSKSLKCSMPESATLMSLMLSGMSHWRDAAALAGRLAAGQTVDMDLFNVRLTIPEQGLHVSYTLLEGRGPQHDAQLALLLMLHSPGGQDLTGARDASLPHRLALAGMKV